MAELPHGVTPLIPPTSSRRMISYPTYCRVETKHFLESHRPQSVDRSYLTYSMARA